MRFHVEIVVPFVECRTENENAKSSGEDFSGCGRERRVVPAFGAAGTGKKLMPVAFGFWREENLCASVSQPSFKTAEERLLRMRPVKKQPSS